MTLPKVAIEIIKKLWLMEQFQVIWKKNPNFDIPLLVQHKTHLK